MSTLPESFEPPRPVQQGHLSEHHTIDEFMDAYQALSIRDQQCLRRAVSGFVSLEREVDDLIQTAILRVLEGRRLWPRHVSLLTFIKQVMRSIASGEAESRTMSPVRTPSSIYGEGGILVVDVPDEARSGEEQLIGDEGFAEIGREVESLFEDDEAAHMILLGRLDGLQGEPLRELTGLDPTAFSKCRLVRRRLNAYWAKRCNQ